MAFILSTALPSARPRRLTASPSTLRPRGFLRPRRSAQLRVPTCAMDENGPSESSYLVDTAPDCDTRVALDTVSTSEPSPAPPPPPGLVQTTRDLDPRVLFGEFLSTFLFVYLSVHAAAQGAALANALNNAAVIAAVAASFMPVSGAHLNPAVTLALAITNRVSLRRALAFVPLQLVAAAAACYLAQAVGLGITFGGIAATASQKELIGAFFAELMPMFIIVIVVFQTAVATEREGGVGSKLAALYIGLAVLACAGTFTTGVFNPARAFGPALVAGNFVSHWVFWVAPCIGASLAALICEHLFLAPASNRSPNSWLASLDKHSASMGSKIKNLGLAGLIAYGIMNTIYYTVVFTFMMFRVGWSSGAGGLAQAWIVTWSFSQVTKPLRLGLSIALAPVIERVMRARRQLKKKA